MDLPKSDESETGRRTGGRILEIYTFQGRKIKVVGWAWEYFWGIGASSLSKNCVFPDKINWNFAKINFIYVRRRNQDYVVSKI